VKSCVEYIRLLQSIQLRLGVFQLIVDAASTHQTHYTTCMLSLHLHIQRYTNIDAVAAIAIDKVGPRPYHFRSGPTSGLTTRPGNQNVRFVSGP